MKQLICPFGLLLLSIGCTKSDIVATASSTTTTSTTYYYQSGGTASETGKTYTSSITDTSGVYVTSTGIFSLVNSSVNTTGNTTSSDSSSFYGLNAIVRADLGSTLTLDGCSLSSTGSGANGVLATGSATQVTMSSDTISTTGSGAHGIDATYAATINATNVVMTTTGDHSSVIATDRGGGSVTVSGGSATASGALSAAIYSTGSITVSSATLSSGAADGAVIEGSNSITLTNTTLTGYTDGVKFYHSESGDASGFTGTLTTSGGSITATAGDCLYVTNETAVINLSNGTTLGASTGYLLHALDTATVTLTASGETLTGSLLADAATSTASVTLSNGSTLKGAVQYVSLTLDATSTWNVTANSVVTGLTDAAGISGTAVSNITGNGYTIYYDASLSSNSTLGGKTYTLSGGGYLKPE
jgi:hypothetical protein